MTFTRIADCGALPTWGTVGDMKNFARLALVLAAVLAGCGGSDPATFNADTLAADIQTKAQARVDKNPDRYGGAATVNRPTCIASNDRQFECVGTTSKGESYSVTATVSADGKHYVTR